MFERYTESARRALFFARYEVHQLGGAAIGTEHLLLGLLRERKGILRRMTEDQDGQSLATRIIDGLDALERDLRT